MAFDKMTLLVQKQQQNKRERKEWVKIYVIQMGKIIAEFSSPEFGYAFIKKHNLKNAFIQFYRP